MHTSNRLDSARLSALALLATVLVAACGGGGTSTIEQPVPQASPPSTGQVGLLFTDKPTEEFSAIKLNVVKAMLLGDDQPQQMLFEGVEPIDLLDLTNFSEPVIFGEVEAGTYTKLRLYIDRLELVPLDGGESIFPRLPANGKIDLLDQDGFTVLPGRTLLAEIDMEANKSIKITGTGNGRKVNFRPVVKVQLNDGGLQDKLARLEGTISEVPSDPAGSFVLCDLDTPDSCIDVSTGDATSFFDGEGLPTDFSSVTVDAVAVVIGRYDVNSDVVLDAVVVEIGGTAEQVKGNVVSNPLNDEFLLLADDDSDFVVEAQIGTKYFDPSGEVGADAVVLGADVEIEGVKVGDPADLIRAALVFVEAEDDEQIGGTIADDPDPATRTFMLTPGDGSNDVCVRVIEEADILLVNATDSEVTMGDFDDLAKDQVVELFGETAADSCFDANEVIVEVIP